MPFSTFPVLNSSGNIVGIIPKNYLIVLIEYHHWLDESKLTNRQKAKLPRMFRRSSFVGDQPSTMDATAQARTMSQDGWFTKEFNPQQVENFKKQKTLMMQAKLS